MKLLCRLGLHKYGRWSSIYRRTFERMGFVTEVLCEADYRALKCAHCGYIHERRFSELKVLKHFDYEDLRFNNVDKAYWPVEDEECSRIPQSLRESFENDILDELWKKDPNGYQYNIALAVLCSAVGYFPKNLKSNEHLSRHF